jgi:hypothetical protein
MNIPPNVDWHEARLAVFLELERLDGEAKRLAALVEVTRDKLEGKMTKDVNELGAKIRNAQDDVNTLTMSARIKASMYGSAFALVSLLVVELLKYFLNHH